jgi:hypothetical protein
MTSPDVVTCPHGKRPGITVCLHCRAEARAAARQRRLRAIMRFGGIALGGGVLIALTVGGLVAVVPRAFSKDRNRDTSRGDQPPKMVIKTTPRKAPAVSVATPTVAPIAPLAAPPAAAAAARTNAPLRILLAEGRTDLADSLYAERAGSDVVVHFDNSEWRTRFEEKFERIVRLTLPRVLGADGRAALDSLPAGTLVRGGNLLVDLPTKGIPLAIPGRVQRVMLYPVTRPGETGPLAVAYRLSVPQ